MRRSRSLSRFRMLSSRMTSLYRTDISSSDLSISVILRNPPLSDPWSALGRESHDPDVRQPGGGNMLRQVLSANSISGARSLNETIAHEAPLFLRSALKRPDA